MTDFLTANLASSSISSLRVIFSAALAFILSVSIGLTYVKTFRGLSYSRNFVQAIMLSSIVTAMAVIVFRARESETEALIESPITMATR